MAVIKTIADGAVISSGGSDLSSETVNKLNNFFSTQTYAVRYMRPPYNASNVSGFDISNAVVSNGTLSSGDIVINTGDTRYMLSALSSKGKSTWVSIKCIESANFSSMATPMYLLPGYNYTIQASSDLQLTATPVVATKKTPAYTAELVQEFINTNFYGLASKMVPSVSSVDEFNSIAQSNVGFMQHKVYKALTSVQNIGLDSYETYDGNGNAITIKTSYDSNNNNYLSVYNGNSEARVSLKSDTDSTYKQISVYPLTENGGYLEIMNVHNSSTSQYDSGSSIQPYCITADGQPSLGTLSSLASGFTGDGDSMYIDCYSSIFDPTNITIIIEKDDHSADTYTYVRKTIAFQGYTNNSTVLAGAETIGTDRYSATHTASYTTTSMYCECYWPIITYSIEQRTKNDDLTSTTLHRLVPHGLYRQEPDDWTVDTLSDGTDFSSVSRGNLAYSKSFPGRVYVICPSTSDKLTYNLNTDFYSDSLWEIYVLDVGNSRFLETSFKLSNIIDDIWM